jgi:hypothetical protein
VPASESPESLGKPVADWLRNWSERTREAQRSDPELQDANAGDDLNALKYAYTFSYVEVLLRYFRPDYDELVRQEQALLIRGACDRINNFHRALQDLVAFAEYGTYDTEGERVKKLKSAADNAQRDVNAALYKRVEGCPTGKSGQGWVPPAGIAKRTSTMTRQHGVGSSAGRIYCSRAGARKACAS